MSSSLEKRIVSRLFQELDEPFEKYTPGLKLQVLLRGEKVVDVAVGETFEYYDLASLTKQLFTVPAIMSLVQRKQISLHTEIQNYLWWWPYSGVTVAQLLNQTSGLEWWRPFYKKMSRLPLEHGTRWDFLKSLLMDCTPTGPDRCVYSDLNFLLLGCIIEEIENCDLDQVWMKMAENWNLKRIHFNRDHVLRYSIADYAPTEKCPWRKKILRGEVHDDNCWALGGVSSHAGLFGPIDDVATWLLLARQAQREPQGSSIAQHDIWSRFTARAVSKRQGDWGLGFWKKSKTGSTSGRYFSPQSFGGTGFTGTSFWFDPAADVGVIILSNRVHPTRKNMRFKELRPKLHDIIREELAQASPF